jgi:predicted transcriptional regulator
MQREISTESVERGVLRHPESSVVNHLLRRRGLFEREAKRPAAEHIPVRDARQTRELD